MKSLIREHIKREVRRIIKESHIFEEREYQLRQLSPGAFDALGPDTLGIPPSAVVDVKIIKAPKPIFKCFLDNGQTFNLIDNDSYMQADINRILFDLDREDDINGAKYELEKLMQKGKIASDDEEEASDDLGGEAPIEEPAAEEPTEEPEV
jgi:hypothetical protein